MIFFDSLKYFLFKIGILNYIFVSKNNGNYNKIEKYNWKTCYYLNDKLHRLDGPAIEGCYGRKEWWQNGLRHRLDAPAVKYIDGYKEWWENGKRHRIDGPAYEYLGTKEWWFEGKHIECNSQEEFERIIKLRLFW